MSEVMRTSGMACKRPAVLVIYSDAGKYRLHTSYSRIFTCSCILYGGLIKPPLIVTGGFRTVSFC